MPVTITTTDTTNAAVQINGVNKLVIGASSQIGIGGTNYGTAGQVLTSGGPSAAPTWSAASSVNLSAYVRNDGASAIGLSGWVWMITAPTLYGWVAGSNLYLSIAAWGMSSLNSGTWRIMQTGQSYYDGSSAYYYPVLVQRTA